jgi:tripartite motif-containing protein 71
LAVDSKNRIIVTDTGGDNPHVKEERPRNQVMVFDSNGEFQFGFAPLGSDPGQLNSPLGVAVDSKDRIIVADAGNHRVQVFDSSGRYLRQFGSLGTGDGQFNMPLHVAVDQRNNILVADSGNDRVQVFGPNGRYTSKFGRARKHRVHTLERVGSTSPSASLSTQRETSS